MNGFNGPKMFTASNVECLMTRMDVAKYLRWNRKRERGGERVNVRRAPGGFIVASKFDFNWIAAMEPR